ncbi:MAG: hypothetical protein Q4A19_08415 [Johnsonella sp.]|nr:hypothetical protein [Johnsonella sp.]
MRKKITALAFIASSVLLCACAAKNEVIEISSAETAPKESAMAPLEENTDKTAEESTEAKAERPENTAVYSEAESLFTQEIYQDDQKKLSLPYNLFLPADYKSEKSYPLVVFLADKEVHGDDPAEVLYQDGALVWASPEEQEVRECIVLAPQYTKELEQSLGDLLPPDKEWSEGLDLIYALIRETMEKYSIDAARIYGTGQGDGACAILALRFKYPELFAAEYLVGPQCASFDLSALKNDKIWVSVSQGDEPSYGMMNQALETWKSLGVPVSQGEPLNPADSLSFDLILENMKNAEATLKYTVFSEGDFHSLCKVAYTVDGIRSWLFAQSK